jgi:hypothetical protein
MGAQVCQIHTIHDRLSIGQVLISTLILDTFCEYVFNAMTKKKKNPHAVALGKIGGSKGGKVRASKLSPERRSEIARKAVLARWAKRTKQEHSQK